MRDFRGRVALVTGASSGIGLATARLLAARGAHVWLVARDPGRLAKALAHVEADSTAPAGTCGMVSADVADAEQVTRAVAHITQQAGLPDLVINSAGITHPGYFQDIDVSVFHNLMEVNYFGTLHVLKAVVPGMMARRSGYVVNVASIAGVIGVFGYSAYAASKFAVRGLTDTVRSELKSYGIRMSLVLPPDTDTPQLAYETELKPPESKVLSGAAHVLSAETVAAKILKGVARNQYMIIPGFEGKFFYWLAGLVGTGQYPIMDVAVATAKRMKGAGV